MISIKNIPLGQLHGKQLVPGWPFYVISYAFWGVVTIRWSTEFQDVGLGSETTILAILVLYGALLGLGTLVTRRSALVAHSYFLVQLLLVIAVLTRYEEMDFFALLFVPLAGQAEHVFSRTPARIWVGVMLLGALIGEIDQFGFPEGLAFFGLYAAGIFFVAVFSETTIESQRNRQRAEISVAKLEEANTQLKRYVKQAENLAAAEERNRLARELHDSVAQTLYGIGLQAEAGRNKLQSANLDQAATTFSEIRDSAQESLTETRMLIHALRPVDLEQTGLSSAIQSRLNSVESRSGLEVIASIGQTTRSTKDVELALFRIAQEALNNVIRHAGANKVEITLVEEPSKVMLMIGDDGIGIAADTTEGFGITGMRERATAYNGTLTLEPNQPRGTLVTAEIPL